MDERSGHPAAAGVAAALGVVAGAATYAATGTLRVLVSPGLDVASPLGWLVGPFWIFAGGLFWGLVGGALFALLPLFLVFLRPPPDTFAWRLAISTAVFLPLFLLGLDGRSVDGALLAIAVWIGVRTGLSQLARRLACAAVIVALAGCTVESERAVVLPWLLQKNTYVAFGSFGGSTQTTYYARHWGFWRGLDVWSASVLDAEHALVSDAEGTAVLRKGSLTPIRVCPLLASPSVPPLAGVVDCVEAVGHSHLGIVEVRARRLDYAGELRSEWTLAAPGERRIFHTEARVLAYDADGVPYFLAIDAEASRDYRIEPRDCALVAPGPDGGTRVVPGPAQMTWEECFQPARWEVVLERPLRAATRQREQPLNAEAGRADPASR